MSDVVNFFRKGQNGALAKSQISSSLPSAQKMMTSARVTTMLVFLLCCLTQTVQASNNNTLQILSIKTHASPEVTPTLLRLLTHAQPPKDIVSTLSSSTDPGKLQGDSLSTSSSPDLGPAEGIDSEAKVNDLPLQGAELGNKVDCLEHQYRDAESHRCENCTVCHPGTEHNHYYIHCGNGEGRNDTCRACDRGRYQDRTGYSGLRCEGCVTCDRNAETLAACEPRRNTQCGPCPKGMYYEMPNICMDCPPGDVIPECAVTSTSAAVPPTVPSSPPQHITTPASEVAVPEPSATTQDPSVQSDQSTTKSPSISSNKHYVVNDTVISTGPRHGLITGLTVGLIVIILAVVCCCKYKQGNSRLGRFFVRYDSVSSSVSISDSGNLKQTIDVQSTDQESSKLVARVTPAFPEHPEEPRLEDPPQPSTDVRRPAELPRTPPADRAPDVGPAAAYTDSHDLDCEGFSMPQSLRSDGGGEGTYPLSSRECLVNGQESCGPEALPFYQGDLPPAPPHPTDTDGAISDEVDFPFRELLSDGGV